MLDNRSSPDLQQRRAGILLHPTSLPSGTLDSDVERWLQVLADAGFSVWQLLPLSEPQSGLSPYQCSSAFALNPALLPAQSSGIDESDSSYIEFCNRQNYWLDDYVLFKVLKQHFNDESWVDWPQQWKFRDADTLQQSRFQYQQKITELKWQQYQLHKRWFEIREKATDLDIVLFGDMPLFIAHDSADVWAHPEWFLLDSSGNMEVVCGVPPDYFSATGQRWGNPHYDWDRMRETDFAWWLSRIRHHLELYDLVRIDHFRGLEAAWMIDASCETAVDGHWQKVPGDELLSAIQLSINSSAQNHCDLLPFVAEDLGVITPQVTALRKKYHLSGMSILQFSFDEFEDNPHKLHNIKEDMVVYTGTHDNDTTKGWFNSLDDNTKKHVLKKLKLPVFGHLNEDDPVADFLSAVTSDVERDSCWYDNVDVADYVVERMIDNAMHSNANICIIPIQDCLHLGSEARMNTPGTTTGNWKWQFQWQQTKPLHKKKKVRLRHRDRQRLIESNS